MYVTEKEDNSKLYLDFLGESLEFYKIRNHISFSLTSIRFLGLENDKKWI